jgi:hypothetical protein
MKGNSTQNLLYEWATLLFFGFKNQKMTKKNEKFFHYRLNFIVNNLLNIDYQLNINIFKFLSYSKKLFIFCY